MASFGMRSTNSKGPPLASFEARLKSTNRLIKVIHVEWVEPFKIARIETSDKRTAVVSYRSIDSAWKIQWTNEKETA